MGRPAKFDDEQILDAAVVLVATDGPAALSITGVAERLGAPSGSIYHRFRSRDALVAAMWLRAVERFQDGWSDALDNDDPRMAARMAAAYVLRWSRANLDAARLLLQHKSSDLLNDGWPTEFKQRNEAQRTRVTEAVEDLARRLGADTTADRRRVAFAIIDIPYGAVRSSLAAGEPPPSDLDSIVDDAVVAVIDGITSRRNT